MNAIARHEEICAAVYAAWRAVAAGLGESTPAWNEAPAWRKHALYHTIGFWESWGSFDPADGDFDLDKFLAATHYSWAQYHRRQGSDPQQPTDWTLLSRAQQRKLRAMFDVYLALRRAFDG